MAISRKPPLALDVEVETPNGTFRLASDADDAAKRPTGMSFSTQRGDGFGPATVSFSRKIFKDYPDINLLDTWRFVGKQGDIAWEGKLHSNPRTNDPTQTISPNLVGWMTYLKSRKVPMLIIDSRLSSWGAPSVQRRANLLAGSRPHQQDASAAWGASGPGLHFEVQNGWSSPTIPICESWFNAGGENVGAVYADWANGWGDANFQLFVRFANNDEASGEEGSGDYYGATTGHISWGPASPSGKHYAFINWYYAITPAGGEGGQYAVDVKNLKVVGAHGLTTQGSWPQSGFYVSDIMQYMVQTYYPKITWAGEPNSFVVQQATWHDSPADGYEILQSLNNLTLWETNVWEERKLYYEPADFTKYDWQIRTDDPGVTVVLEGDSIENFANGVSVTFTDFAGVTKILWPNEHSELRDENENNPANIHDENLWTDCSIPFPCSEPEALQFGRTRLAEFNRAKKPGTFKVSGGYIQDAAGHWHQGWKVRSSDTIAIMNHPDEEPRLIYATNWDDDSKTLDITVDAPPVYLDAIVARQEVALGAAGLS